ncbi:hypothetical protein EVAR_27446_1 [Eumeta japonica]|uniref:Uncharacterized protein n=1 Tax=Eumeta variegata TaxID=151549 RepID=A0A4C1VJC1_EUMVA|nr:hypothetical protein EVAR_27446_1 [Eumeta japonica]
MYARKPNRCRDDQEKNRTNENKNPNKKPITSSSTSRCSRPVLDGLARSLPHFGTSICIANATGAADGAAGLDKGLSIVVYWYGYGIKGTPMLDGMLSNVCQEFLLLHHDNASAHSSLKTQEF